jgi:hypothetical protein
MLKQYVKSSKLSFGTDYDVKICIIMLFNLKFNALII